MEILGLSIIIAGTIMACVELKKMKKLDEIIKLLKTLEDDAEHEEIYNMVQERKSRDNGERYTMDDLRKKIKGEDKL